MVNKQQGLLGSILITSSELLAIHDLFNLLTKSRDNALALASFIVDDHRYNL